MARGTTIVVTVPQQGNERELIVPAGETWYPGMIVQVDASVALKHGRHTGKIYDRSVDGEQPLGPFYVVTERNLTLFGKGITDALTFDGYAAGIQASVYLPQAGDELNLLLANLAGTADDHPLNEILMVDDGTGKLIATTGTPETEVAVLKEVVTDPTADQLVWVEWSGH